MPTIFDQITYQRALQLLGMARTGLAQNPDKIEIVKSPVKSAFNNHTSGIRFFRGDHWQDASGWVGPCPEPSAGAQDVTLTMELIRRNFISHNAIKDITVRHRDGVLGSEPMWTLLPDRPLAKIGDVVNGKKITEDEQPNPQEQAQISQATAAITNWWDAEGNQILNKLQESVINMLTDDNGKAYLRLFIPTSGGLAVEGQTGIVEIPQGGLDESFERIFLDVPDSQQAAIYTDPESMGRVGIYSYSYTTLIDFSLKQYVELTYLDENEQTVVRRMEPSGQLSIGTKIVNAVKSLVGANQSDASSTYELNGHLIIFELNGEPLVTEQVKKNQALLNMALTMLGHNVVTAGFLERVLLNAQLPGHTEEVDDGKGGKVKTFIPDPYVTGSGTTNVIQSSTFKDRDGHVHVLPANIKWREPAKVSTFVETAERAYLNILREGHQVHTLITHDARVSGEASKQARDDYEKSLKKTKTVIDAAGRWLIETVLAMAAKLSGQAGAFDNLRAVFDCRIDVGPLSALDRAAIIQEVQADLMPRDVAMSLLGSEDPEAWMTKIAAEKVILNPQPQPPKGLPPPGNQPMDETAGQAM